jgi:hypothetical protein
MPDATSESGEELRLRGGRPTGERAEQFLAPATPEGESVSGR